MPSPETTTPPTPIDPVTPPFASAPAGAAESKARDRPLPNYYEVKDYSEFLDYDECRRSALATIAEEIETYQANLPNWGEHEGKWVLIRGREVIGFFEKEHDTIDLAYERFEGQSFMVKQVRAIEPIRYCGNVNF